MSVRKRKQNTLLSGKLIQNEVCLLFYRQQYYISLIMISTKKDNFAKHFNKRLYLKTELWQYVWKLHQKQFEFKICVTITQMLRLRSPMSLKY